MIDLLEKYKGISFDADKDFKPSSKDNRVLIVDFTHMAHIYQNSQHRLSKSEKIGSEVVTIDTTVANGCLKNIYRWSKKGMLPTVICFDRPCPSRRAYFEDKQQDGVNGSYKGDRISHSNGFFEAIERTCSILEKGGVSCLYRYNWEADDLIMLAIEKARELYPDYYIDLVTNDADLLPLVSKRVSVFFRSKKGTYAESKELEKNKYIQVTPENYQEVIEDLSAFKKMYVPYNSLLLYKVLRGDSADSITSPYPKNRMTPKYIASLIWQMEYGLLKEGYELVFEKGTKIANGIKKSKTRDVVYFEDDDFSERVPEFFVLTEDGCTVTVDIENTFRYFPVERYFYNENTNQEITYEEAVYLGKANGAKIGYRDNIGLNHMCDVLKVYGFTDDEAEIFKRQYRGMNLAQTYDVVEGSGDETGRSLIKIGDFGGFSNYELSRQASQYDINLR